MRNVKQPSASEGASLKPLGTPGARKAIVRRSILAGAAKLFAERGFAATALQDVADALHISRPTVYYYFPSKESILDALVEDVMASTMELVELPSRPGADQADEYVPALRRSVRSISLDTTTNQDVFRVLNASGRQLPRKTAERFLIGKTRTLSRLTQLLEGGVRAGAFRQIDCEIAAAALLAMASFMGLANTISTLPAQELADTVADMAVRSIASHGDAQAPRPAQLFKRIREDLSLLERLAPSPAAKRARPARKRQSD